MPVEVGGQNGNASVCRSSTAFALVEAGLDSIWNALPSVGLPLILPLIGTPTGGMFNHLQHTVEYGGQLDMLVTVERTSVHAVFQFQVQDYVSKVAL